MHLCPIEFFFDPVKGVVTNLSASPEFGESATFGQDGSVGVGRGVQADSVWWKWCSWLCA